MLLLMAATALARAVPIHIAADHAKVFQQTGKSVYTGDVMIRRGPVTLRGDKLIVHRIEDGEIRAELLGDPARLERETKDGQPVTGHAQRVIYSSAKDIVKLVGNAFLKQGGNSLSSDLIRHDLATARTVAGRGEDARVRITLQPDSAEQAGIGAPGGDTGGDAGSDTATPAGNNSNHGS